MPIRTSTKRQAREEPCPGSGNPRRERQYLNAPPPLPPPQPPQSSVKRSVIRRTATPRIHVTTVRRTRFWLLSNSPCMAQECGANMVAGSSFNGFTMCVCVCRDARCTTRLVSRSSDFLGPIFYKAALFLFCFLDQY